MRLYDEDSTWDEHLGTTTTDENGYYLFDGLTPGAYVVTVTDDAGTPGDPADDTATASKPTTRRSFPPDFGWGAAAGISGGSGLVFLYRGLGRSRMGVVAPTYWPHSKPARSRSGGTRSSSPRSRVT